MVDHKRLKLQAISCRPRRCSPNLTHCGLLKARLEKILIQIPNTLNAQYNWTFSSVFRTCAELSRWILCPPSDNLSMFADNRVVLPSSRNLSRNKLSHKINLVFKNPFYRHSGCLPVVNMVAVAEVRGENFEYWQSKKKFWTPSQICNFSAVRWR